MILRLSYSGHYPDRRVEVTKEEYYELLRVEGKRYLFDTREGRALIRKLEQRPDIPEKVITVYQ